MVQQYAKDISAFLMRAAESKRDERKRLGFGRLIFLIVYTRMLFLVDKERFGRAPRRRQASALTTTVWWGTKPRALAATVFRWNF
jgi:hypothetical protein